MDNQKLILVTHKGPDMDAVASVWLYLAAHKIPWDRDDLYEMRFVNPGQRYTPTLEEQHTSRIIHFDTGKEHDEFNFDHHQLGSREISATGLVWNRFFSDKESAAINELASLVNYTDNGLTYHTNNLVARHLFSMRFWLSGANKLNSKNGDDFIHTMFVGFSMLDAYIANYIEVESFKKITENMEIFDSAFGRTVILYNVPGNASSLRSFLKKYHNDKNGDLVNTCVVEFSEGSIGVIVCIDPGQEQEEDEDSENYPAKISLNEEMEEVEVKLREIDSDPKTNIYLHQSRFALFINRSELIKMEDVLKIMKIKT